MNIRYLVAFWYTSPIKGRFTFVVRNICIYIILTTTNIVYFRYVLEHLSRICRVLRIPGGNALLVGVGGSGRQSLTRLATAMAGYEIFQPEISKNYGKVEWREDIKVL